MPSRRASARLFRVSATLLLTLGALALQPPAALAQQIYAYPTKGQSPEQQARDQQECSGWATQQTGYNPAYPPPSSGGGQPLAGGMLRGAAGGAAIGAVGGAIGGNAGKGAAIGAGAGALFGGIRQHERNRAQAQQQAAYSQQAYDAYRRAMSACLQGRGYSVQ